MRMIRDSPPELDLLLPAPNASTKTTLAPALWSSWAVHDPKTPAPITTTSHEIFDMVRL